MTASEATPTKPRITVAEVQQELAVERNARARLSESFAELKIQLEDRHWQRILGGNVNVDNRIDGLDLDSIRTVSEDLRVWIAAGILKRVSDLRYETIYGDGVGFKDYAKAKTAFGSVNNIDMLFSVRALGEISRAHDTDGRVVFLVNTATKQIERYFIDEMGDPYVDGRNKERIWLERRTFNEVSQRYPEGKDITEFYPTDICPPELANKRSLKVSNVERIPINSKYVAIAWDVNKQGGWPFGIPNLVAALTWAIRYTGFLKNQDKFAEALASIAWEASVPNSDTGKKVTAQVETEQVAGTNVHTSDIEFKALGGNSEVSFENGQPMAALVAALGGVTVEALLAKEQVAAASTMDPNMKKMAQTARQNATDFFKRIGRLLGAPNLEVIWPDLETESPFREAQMIISAYGQGLFEPDEVRGPLAHRVRIAIKEGSKAPKDAIVPGTQRAMDAAAAAKAAAAPEPSDGSTNGQGNDALDVGKLSDDDNTARDKGEV